MHLINALVYIYVYIESAGAVAICRCSFYVICELCWLWWECLSLSRNVLVHLLNASVLRRSHQLQRPAMRTPTTNTTLPTTAPARSTTRTATTPTTRRWTWRQRQRQQELAQQNHTNLSTRLFISVRLLRKCIGCLLIFASELSIRCSRFSLLWLAVRRMTLHKPYIEHIYWNSLTLYIIRLELLLTEFDYSVCSVCSLASAGIELHLCVSTHTLCNEHMPAQQSSYTFLN